VPTARGSTVTMELRSDSYFTPADLAGGTDTRRLSVVLHEMRFEPIPL